VGALGITFCITLRILESSFIKFTLLCKRPAVSIITTSASFDMAELRVSKATAAGSAPICCLTIGTSTLLAQIVSCSTAAALNVSAAPSITFFPWFLNMKASLPIVVVFPTPFTPTTIITYGLGRFCWVLVLPNVFSASSEGFRFQDTI